jgi:signal transduction histidine kinase
MTPRRSSGVFIAVLLLLALGLAGLLAFQAQATFLYHRATAERVLRDYARLAAARFAQRTAQNFYYHGFAPALETLSRRPSSPLPEPAKLAAGLDEHAAPFVARARYTFRLDLHSGALVTAGERPTRPARHWLIDTLRVHARTSYDAMERMAAIIDTAAGAPRLAVYTVVKDKSGVARFVLGFETDPRTLEPFYTLAADKFPLLPRPLTGGIVYDSAGSVVVSYHNGVELYRSPVQYEQRFVARDSLDAAWGGLRFEVTLRPEMASKLVIGGLPRSRLPVLLGVLALTAGLIVTALLQLRREYDLARLRTDFVSGVSHELRTPLAQIRMFGETLLLGRIRSDEERRRSLEIIDQEARRLTHLVENLLHFSRTERRIAHVAPEPVALAPLVRAVIESFAPLAAARRVQVRSEVPEGAGVLADPGALRQMLLNLLDNAVKYGPEGQTITVGLAHADADQRVRLYVEDEGPGIPTADHERVWERFWRLERDRDTAVAGTGIGLAVVRELAALHSGRAWVEDGGGGSGRGGARFLLELPAAQIPTTPRPGGTGGPERPASQPVTQQATA